MTYAKQTVALLLSGVLIASPAVAQPGNTPPPVPTGPSALPGAPPAPAPIPLTGLNAQPLTPDERGILREVESDWKRYIGQAEQHHTRMRDLLLRSVSEKTAELEAKFAKQIAAATTRKQTAHGTSIELLEKFIADHPAHKQFTPDAMYRLADLYLDVSDDAVDVADVSAEVIADYSKSLSFWDRILGEFPQYRQVPSVLYLLGYYGKTTNERRSLLLFLSLACANKFTWTDPVPPELTREAALARIDRKDRIDPYADCQPWPGSDAELIRHAWLRGIADYHFTVPGEVDQAIAGYLKVVDNGQDSPLYAESLYKLAWSFYKRDFFLDSIKRFDESVKLYDEIVAKGIIPALELRDESLQYIAVAFTDPWEGEADTDPVKAFERAKTFYKGRENEAHVRDVWDKLGDAFVELQAYDQAVDAYRIAISPPWELNPQNPSTHQKIATTFELKGDKFAADSTAADLAIRYAPGTPWYIANEKDREAMDNQRQLAERALYVAARNTHLAATNMRKEYEAGGKTEPTIREDYLKLYADTVNLYKVFIEQYPDSDYVYEFTYAWGEALYFSERYLEAIEKYRWVRDHSDLSDAYAVQSAKDILTSYEAEVARQVAAGALPKLEVPSSAALKAMPQPLTPQPIPELYATMQQEWDEYQNVVNDPKSAPIQGLNAALVSLAYLHVDDAIVRMEKVMSKFCGAPEMVKAKDALLSVYEATSQLDKFSEVNNRFISSKCGDAKSIELAQSQNRSIEFKLAEKLSAQGNYVGAADSFYHYYKTAPNNDADLPTALYNAAANYSLGDRPKTAISLFKEFTQNTDKLFRQSPYYLEAMRLTAQSQQSVFDYDAAIATNLALYNVAKEAKKQGINPPPPFGDEKPRTTNQIALEALFNAAALAELDRDFKQAVALFTQYDREETERRLKDRALWSIARIYKASVDPRNLVTTLDRWRKLYGNDTENADDLVASYDDAAMVWKRKGKTKDADVAGQAAIAAWTRTGSPKNTKGARLAGKWSLEFAEKHFTTKFEPYKITESAKDLKRAQALKAALEKATVATQDQYAVLEDYGVAEYSMAYRVRYGETMARFAEKLAQAPTPKFILAIDKKNPDAGAIAAYENQLATNLDKYIQQAKAQWLEVVELAKKNGISNQWSQLAMENLNREFPDKFPVLHQELFTGTEAP